MAVKLTERVISLITTGKWQPSDIKPVFQVLDILLVSPDNKERYRVTLSDGSSHRLQVMLAPWFNDLVRSQQLQPGSVVQLNEFVINSIHDHWCLVILVADVIQSSYGIIGDANPFSPKIIRIAALNPYENRWTIKARMTAKSELRHYNNAEGDGRVFYFDLLDSNGGEIRTIFNSVADRFYDQIEVGKVYFISKGTIKPAQKAFNYLNNHHEITLDHTSIIQPCLDDDRSIPQQRFRFCSIAEIEKLDNNTILDIIGVVYAINSETEKRTLSLKDKSGRSVELTLRGNFCKKEICDAGTFLILAVKSVRVGEFNGKNVGTICSSQMCIEPDIAEARELKTWYDNVGKNIPSVSLSHDATDVRKTIFQIRDETLGTNEKPDWITVSATLSFIKVKNFCYTACPLMLGERKCSKKVGKNSDEKWICYTCDEIVDECDYRYILQLQIQDQTGVTWAVAFQETGEDIMGISAKDLYYILHEEGDEERFTEIVRNAIYNRYNFKLKVNKEGFGYEQHVKSTVVEVEKVKASSDTSFLLDLLKKDTLNY